ncbi:hypothetical protein TMatcc_008440 [Talaromyces marneffei ATCC 18224]
MTVEQTIIQQFGDIESNPLQRYGEGQTILRIGNGGAGGTGLVKALAQNYLSSNSIQGSIEWICNHSRNTQLALFNGYIDIALTYEREQEEISVTEGWAMNAGCVFHDHFCLVGPENDPANVREANSIEEAFELIAAKKSPFHSRADGSATMCKEREIWRRCHRSPWLDGKSSTWYLKTKFKPAEALVVAANANAYLLVDRSTFLSQLSRRAFTKMSVFFEPTNPLHYLMNSCYALYNPNPDNKHIEGFIAFIKSNAGQEVIASFGIDKAGIPYFASVEQEIARPSLAGGRQGMDDGFGANV